VNVNFPWRTGLSRRRKGETSHSDGKGLQSLRVRRLLVSYQHRSDKRGLTLFDAWLLHILAVLCHSRPLRQRFHFEQPEGPSFRTAPASSCTSRFFVSLQNLQTLLSTVKEFRNVCHQVNMVGPSDLTYARAIPHPIMRLSRLRSYMRL
jgi:hypothetical protein